MNVREGGREEEKEGQFKLKNMGIKNREGEKERETDRHREE